MDLRLDRLFALDIELLPTAIEGRPSVSISTVGNPVPTKYPTDAVVICHPDRMALCRDVFGPHLGRTFTGSGIMISRICTDPAMPRSQVLLADRSMMPMHYRFADEGA